jgi:hypothetical protein
MGDLLNGYSMLLQFIRLIIFLFIYAHGGKIGSEICSCFTSILIMYLLIHSLTEGNYIYEVFKLRRLVEFLTIY